MPANKILYGDNLRQGTDKINAVVDVVNKAEIDSAAAKVTADSAKTTASFAVTTVNNGIQTITNKANATQAQVDTLVLENGTSDAEILQSRIPLSGPTFSLLKDRLDYADSLLESESKKAFYADLVTHKSQRPMITILDDDVRTQLYNIIFPILVETNTPLTSAAITGRIGTNVDTITLAQFEEMRDSGLVEFISHTKRHINLTSLTLDEVDAELRDSKEWLAQNGVKTDHFVYPFNGQNRAIRALTKKYYKSGFSTNGKLVKPPVETFLLNRVDFESTFDQQKAWIDEAIATNSWVVFNTHSSYPSFTGQGLRDLITYAKSVGIEFVTVEEGMRQYGNLIEVGDPENVDGMYAAMGANGEMVGNLVPGYKLISKNGLTNASPLSFFPAMSMSAVHISTAEATAMGFPYAGTLIVNRQASDGYSFRHYFKYQSAEILHSYWSGTEWSSWQPVEKGKFRKSITDAITSSTQPSAMTTEQKENVFTTKIQLANATGFPENLPGTCITDVTNGAGYDFQLYYIASTNRVYKRFHNGTIWTAFERIDFYNIVKAGLVSVGVVAANSTKQVNVSSGLFKLGDSLIVNPKFALPAGILPAGGYIDADGTAKIIVYNSTGASIDLGTNEWILKPIKNA